jgi:hypothetical protein
MRCNHALYVVLALVMTGVACQAPQPTIEGLWLSDGYGTFAEISPTTVTLYEITAISCLQRDDEVASVSQEPDGSWRIAVDEPTAGTMTLESESIARFQPVGTVSYRTFRRVAARPTVCQEPIQSTPLTSFDVFWTTYNEHYPFFELKEVDWDAVRAEARPRVTESTTPEELFDLLAEMIAPLEDAHTSISAESLDRRSQGIRPDPELQDVTSVAEAGALLMERFKRALEIVESRYLQGKLHSLCQGHLRYGRLADGLGYMWLDQEGGYTDNPGFAAQLETFDEALDTIFTELGDARGLILDVRKNFGGSDVLSLALASRLTAKDYLAYAKVARLDPDDPDRRTPPQESYVRVSPRPGFHGPVVQLIGRYTISAGETLTQALMGREPHILRVGENTQGVFSDVMDRRLPNGWRFRLPNELFLTKEGTSFDGPGIPPDVKVPVFRADDLDAGRDPALEKARELLASR